MSSDCGRAVRGAYRRQGSRRDQRRQVGLGPRSACIHEMEFFYNPSYTHGSNAVFLGSVRPRLDFAGAATMEPFETLDAAAVRESTRFRP